MSNRMEFNQFLEDMSLYSDFRILEESADKEKLAKIAAKRGIVLPAHDLAIFECIYAYTDRQNKNGCTLPKEEVEKALSTIVGKSINLDHLRKRVVGHWVDAELKGNEIIAYGVFFKDSFKEDYEIVKELFSKGNLAISLEAWGDREYHKGSKKNYDLTNIEFAGGALLIKTEPAFAGASVLEMAKKERVLEMAKVMTKPDTFFHERKKEDSSYRVNDMESVMKAMYQVPCAGCEDMYTQEPQMIDFAGNKMKTKCYNCGTEMMLNLTPSTTVTKKGRQVKSATELKTASVEDVDAFVKEFSGEDDALSMALEEATEPSGMPFSQRATLKDDDFAVVKVINLAEDKTKKIRMFPIHDLAHICATANRLDEPQVRSMLDKLGITLDNMEGKILRKATCISMKSLLEKYKKNSVLETIQEIAKASISRELNDSELEKAYNLVELKATGKNDSTTSFQSLKSGKGAASETSIQNANVSEDDVKAIVTEVTKAAVVPPAPAPVNDTRDSEIASLKAQVADVTAKLTQATAKLDEINKASRDAEIKKRKDELTEAFAKDMSDEDILDDVKFELAKLKKENAELKAGKTPVKTVAAAKPVLTKGSADKEGEDAIKTSRSKVDDYAFGRDGKTDE